MTKRAHISVPGVSSRGDGARGITRALPDEVPVALVYNGATQAVMMATPADLEDFARGFSLSEGIVSDPAQLGEIEIVEQLQGIEARMWLSPERAAAMAERRRAMAGPVGCGLCGIDSLQQAIRPLPRVAAPDLRWNRDVIASAPDQLRAHQQLHDRTHAAHAAGFLRPDGTLVAVREDVGRHNALDKLIGALAASREDPGTGAVVMTSRVSVELVQKCALAGIPVLIAVSAPTARAVEIAQAAGITIAAFARKGAFDLYAHPSRIETGAHDVA